MQLLLPPDVPTVTVVVTGKNVEGTIERCLISIVNQSLRPIQIVYVDGGSTDASAKLAKAYATDIITSHADNPAKGRNLGINLAKGDIIAFIDADCEIPETWLAQATHALADKKLGIVGGAYLAKPISSSQNGPSISLSSPLFSGGSIQHRPKSRPSLVESLPAGLMAVTRTVISEIGSFDPKLDYCEDAELCSRARSSGYDVMYLPALSSYHIKDYSLSSIWNMGYRYGLGRAKATTIHPKLLRLRHVLPTCLVAVALLILSYPLNIRLSMSAASILVFYLATLAVQSAWISVTHLRSLSQIPYVLGSHLALHFAYGLGFAGGVLSLARREALTLGTVLLGLFVVIIEPIKDVRFYGGIIGWDTPHYVYVANILQEKGVLAFLNFQNYAYLLYPSLLYSISIITDTTPLFVEQYLPIAMIGCLLVSTIMLGYRTFQDTITRVFIPMFFVVWLTPYRLGADLHNNLLALVMMTIALAFSLDYLKARRGLVLVPVAMFLSGLSQPQTSAFGLAIVSFALIVPSVREGVSVKRALLLFLSGTTPIVMSILTDTRVIGSLATAAEEIPWPPNYVQGLGFLLFPLFLVSAAKLAISRKPQTLLLTSWLGTTILVVVAGYVLPGTRDWATRALLIFPLPLFLSDGVAILFRAVLSLKPSKLRVPRNMLRFGVLAALIFLTLSGLIMSAAQAQQFAGIHMRSFLSDDATLAIANLKQAGIVDRNTVFLFNGADNLVGRVAEYWDNSIGANLGDHYAYVGNLFYFLRGVETPFRDQLTQVIAHRYYSRLASSGQIDDLSSFIPQVVIIEPFYSGLSGPQFQILQPLSPGVYLLSKDVAFQTMLEMPLILGAFSDKISAVGHWYGMPRTWAVNPYVLELYIPDKSVQTMNYSATYNFLAPKAGTYNVSVSSFDYEKRYAPISLCLDDTCQTTYYGGSLSPMTFHSLFTIKAGVHTVVVKTSGSGPFIVNLDYIAIVQVS